MLNLLYGLTLTSIHDYWKNLSFEHTDLCWQSDGFLKCLPGRMAIMLENVISRAEGTGFCVILGGGWRVFLRIDVAYLAWNHHPEKASVRRSQLDVPWALRRLSHFLGLFWSLRRPGAKRNFLFLPPTVQSCDVASPRHPAPPGSVSRDQETIFHPRSQAPS